MIIIHNLCRNTARVIVSYLQEKGQLTPQQGEKFLAAPEDIIIALPPHITNHPREQHLLYFALQICRFTLESNFDVLHQEVTDFFTTLNGLVEGKAMTVMMGEKNVVLTSLQRGQVAQLTHAVTDAIVGSAFALRQQGGLESKIHAHLLNRFAVEELQSAIAQEKALSGLRLHRLIQEENQGTPRRSLLTTQTLAKQDSPVPPVSAEPLSPSIQSLILFYKTQFTVANTALNTLENKLMTHQAFMHHAALYISITQELQKPVKMKLEPAIAIRDETEAILEKIHISQGDNLRDWLTDPHQELIQNKIVSLMKQLLSAYYCDPKLNHINFQRLYGVPQEHVVTKTKLSNPPHLAMLTLLEIVHAIYADSRGNATYPSWIPNNFQKKLSQYLEAPAFSDMRQQQMSHYLNAVHSPIFSQVTKQGMTEVSEARTEASPPLP